MSLEEVARHLGRMTTGVVNGNMAYLDVGLAQRMARALRAHIEGGCVPVSELQDLLDRRDAFATRDLDTMFVDSFLQGVRRVHRQIKTLLDKHAPAKPAPDPIVEARQAMLDARRKFNHPLLGGAFQTLDRAVSLLDQAIAERGK